MKRHFRAALAVMVVGVCMLGLAGCGGSAAKGKGKEVAAAPSINPAIAAGDAALARGERNEAGRLYLTALNSGADPATAHTRLGDLYLGSGAFPQAMDAYQQALKANPKFAPALQGMGFSLYLGGGKGQAGEFLAKALALDPSLSRAAALLGTIDNREGRPEAALAVSDASLAVAFDADVENNRGISLMLLGRVQEASTAFYKAVSAKKSVKFSNNLGLSLCRLGRYDEAYVAFAGVATESAALNNLGVCYMEAGNKPKAQEFFEKAIAANPRFYPQAHDNLSRLSAMEEVTLPVAPQALPATPAAQAGSAPGKPEGAATPPAKPAPAPSTPPAAKPTPTAAPATSPAAPAAPAEAAKSTPASTEAAKPVSAPAKAPSAKPAAPAKPAPASGAPLTEPKPFTAQPAPAGEAAATPAKAPEKTEAAKSAPAEAAKPAPAEAAKPVPTKAAKSDASAPAPGAPLTEPKPFTPQPAPAGEAAATPAKTPEKTEAAKPAPAEAAKPAPAKAAKSDASAPAPGAPLTEPKPFTPQPAPTGEAPTTPAKTPDKTEAAKPAPAKHRPAAAPSAAEKLDRSEMP